MGYIYFLLYDTNSSSSKTTLYSNIFPLLKATYILFPFSFVTNVDILFDSFK
jgi:hypothetical protein